MKKNTILTLVGITTLLLISLLIISKKYSLWPSWICSKTESTQTSSPINSNVMPIEEVTLITEVTTPEEFENLRKDEMPILIKFYATWCGACQYVDTYFPALAQHFKGKVTFYTINNDNKTITDLIEQTHFLKEPIAYLPTFVLMKHGSINQQIIGVKEFEYMQSKIAEIFSL